MLKTEHLSYSANGKQLLNGVSLTFSTGHLHGIVGPNGSGKSTFLKTLSGIWKPSSGKIFWNATELHTMDRQEMSRIISLVPQNPQVSFDFSVEEIIAMGRYANHPTYWTSEKNELLNQAMMMADVWHLRDRPIRNLSQGERQRVYIARSLATDAPILLFDEPTANLDIAHQIGIWQLLTNLVQEGKIVVVSTHDISLAERHCHLIAVINQGGCTKNGTVSSTLTPDLMKEVFGVKAVIEKGARHFVL